MVIAKIIIAILLQVGEAISCYLIQGYGCYTADFLNLFLEIVDFLKNKKRKEKMLRLRESKKGFTLIELMVVVVIFGVLVLMSLRTYATQKERATNSVAKANADTVQIMLVSYMGSHDILLASAAADITAALNGVVPETGHPLVSMVNPYIDTAGVYHIDTAGVSDFDAAAVGHQGEVSVLCKADNNLLVNARGKEGELLFDLNNALPASKH